jgi:tetratricopeptide (TPR) repeat protein
MLHWWLVLQLSGGLPLIPGVPADERLDRLQQWLTAAERHQPGTVDDPARLVRRFDRLALSDIHDDLATIGALIVDPGAPIVRYEVVRNPEAGRPASAGRGYTPNQVRGLRALARQLSFGSASTDLLERGALLHTDIALRAPPAPEMVASTATPALQRTTLYLGDGRQQGLDQSVGHLEMARRLLDLVRPNPQRDDKPAPERDPHVRDWYRATTAVLLARRTLELSHFTRAVALFPDDPEILLIAGALRETLAGARVQDGVRTARLPSGLSYDIDSDRTELRRAEGLLRRSLAVDPDRVEARIRLGRVLGLLGRSEDAARELRAALRRAPEPLLEYFAALFLGREADTLGHRDEARRSYERAAALFPRAQSPRLALSELAMHHGDASVATAALDSMWRLSSVGQGEDPWWDYLPLAGRGGEASLDALNGKFPVPAATR